MDSKKIFQLIYLSKYLNKNIQIYMDSKNSIKIDIPLKHTKYMNL
jgi:hypothetical protein